MRAYWVLGLAALGASAPVAAQTVNGACGHLPLPPELAGKQVILATPASKTETNPCTPGTVVTYTLIDGQQVSLAVSANAATTASTAPVAAPAAPPRTASLAELTNAPERDDPFTLQLAKAWNVGPKELLAEDRAKAVMAAANAPARRAEIKAAAQAGDAAAQWIYGYDLLAAAQDSAGSRMAAEWFAKSADQGFAPAQYELADLIRNGQGVKFDKAKMLDLLIASAGAGDAYAQTLASNMLTAGYYVKEDVDAGKIIEKRLADRGFEPAVIKRLHAELTGPESAARLADLKARADGGSGLAALMLSGAYLNGTGVAKDKVEAARYAEMAASRDYTNALSDAASVLRTARGKDKDKLLADQLYAKQLPLTLAAANKGNASEQMAASTLYLEGNGIPKDTAAAHGWLTKAAATGLPPARMAVATYKKVGFGGFARDCGAAMAELQGLSQEGYVDADVQIAQDYYWAGCNSRSYDMTRRYYERVAVAGNTAQRAWARSYLDYVLKNKRDGGGGGFLDAVAQAAPVVIGALNQASAELAAQRQADAAQQAQINRQYQNAMQAAQQRQQQTSANLAAAAAARDAQAARTEQARQEALRRQQLALAQVRAAAPRPASAVVAQAPIPQRVVTAPPPRPAAPVVEKITMLEGVVVCPLNPDRARLFGEATCYGPFTEGMSNYTKVTDMAVMCGASSPPPRDLGTYGNNRVWGCNYGINPRKSGSPNVDQAQKFGLNIPSRQTYRCDAKIDGYCRGN